MFEHFSYHSYKNLLKLLIKKSVNVCFEDFPLPNNLTRYFILRHDVDFSPEAALKMAELEQKVGIRASYFILLNSPYYNLFSENYCSFPRCLIELGHEVGFHYDLKAFPPSDKTKAMETLRAYVKIVMKFTGKGVKSIAMHNPSINGQDWFRNSKEFINVYDDKYTKRIAYFSDSCGAWRDEAIRVFESGNVPPKLQLLIHPFFWNEKPVDRWNKLDNFIEEKNLNLKRDAQQIREIWTKHPGVIQHDKRNNLATPLFKK